ncbi:MAG: DUF3459 domain-containing protein [Bryobacteraceae bacterium]
MTALYLLGPNTPMLFQGQEFASSAPFLYFADMPNYLQNAVRRGRREFLRQFRSLDTNEMTDTFVDPCSVDTFARCKLNFSERETNRWCYAMYRELLRIRREDPVIRLQGSEGFDGAVLASHALALRYSSEAQGDRLLIVNLGASLHLHPAPEPLLAPPDDADWTVLFSTEHPDYGGRGTAPVDSEDNWRIPGNAAVLLQSLRQSLGRRAGKSASE